MSLQTGRSQRSFTFDADTQLKDAGAISATAAAQVGGSDRVLDFGNVSPGPAVEQVAYVMGWLVLDITELDRTTADEFYDLVFQLSDNASAAGTGFDAGDFVTPKCVIHLGEELGDDGDADGDATALGRIVVGVDNERLGTLFRFARMDTVVGGTTPTINYTAFLSR